MLESLRTFARICADTLPLPDPILEFGAYQVEGQEGLTDLRGLFPGRQYVGTDMRPGPGVDKVLDLHHLDLPDASVGTALVFETLEHVEHPRQAMAELRRVLRDDGILVVTTPFDFPIHNHPHDYWRFTPQGMTSLLHPFGEVFVDAIGDPDNPSSVLAVASPGQIPAAEFETFRRALAQQQQFWARLTAVLEGRSAPGADAG